MRGGQVQELVSLVDLTPTLLDAAGISIPDVMQGSSILPIINKQETSWAEEVFVQISETNNARAIRTERWKYGVMAPEPSGNDQMGSDVYEEACLYDLHADPYELHNIIGITAFDAVAADMRQRLISRMEQAGEPAPTIVHAAAKRSGQRRVNIADMRVDHSNGPVPRNQIKW
jgi:arylsulfatase A-like enzyme